MYSPQKTFLTSRRNAFTLVEILVVITIISIVIAVSSLSFGTTMQSISLSNAGIKVTHIMDVARQRAMAANSMTAVLLITDVPGGDPSAAGRTMTILERQVGGTWQQIWEWEQLPAGVVVDTGAAADNITFISKSPAKLPGNASPPAYMGNDGYSYALRAFLPGGGVTNPGDPARLQIVSGHVANGAVDYTRKGPDGGPANYYRITLIGATGKTKVDRP